MPNAKNAINAFLALASTILLTLTMVFFSGNVQAKNQPWNITGMNYPPLVYATDESQFTGTVAETVKALCKAGNLDCNFDRMPLKRSLHLLKNDQLDATITIVTGKPMPCCVRTNWETPWAAGFFSHQNNTPAPMTAKDLTGQTVITVLGMKSPYTFAPTLDEMADNDEMTLYKAPGIRPAVDMFMARRAPLLWGSADFFWHIQQHYDEKVPDFHPRLSFPMVLWVRKDNAALLNALNLGFERLKENGALDADGLLKKQKPDS